MGGVISPGPDKTGKTPAAVRLYSIASSAVGDNENEKTVSLCVKRVVELDGKFANREVGEDKPDKAGTNFPKNKVYRGVASNYICDLNVGDEVLITGPVGTEMLLPQDPDSVLIMLATGTGIAPMGHTFVYYSMTRLEQPLAGLESLRVWLGFSWEFLIPNLCSMTTRTRSIRKISLTSTATNMQSPVSRRMLQDKKCTSKRSWLSMLKSSGISCNTKRPTSTCVA